MDSNNVCEIFYACDLSISAILGQFGMVVVVISKIISRCYIWDTSEICISVHYIDCVNTAMSLGQFNSGQVIILIVSIETYY